MIQDHKGNVLLSSNNGVFKYDYIHNKKLQTYNFKYFNINIDAKIKRIDEIKKGIFIVSTFSDGVYLFDQDNNNTSRLFQSSAKFSFIYIINYIDGVLFMVTDQGLFSYAIKNKLLTEHGLLKKNNKAYIYNIYPLNKGLVLLGMSNGLILYNISNNTQVNIDISHLIPDANFNHNSVFLHGYKLYLGTVAGIVIIDLLKLNINEKIHLPPVIINEVEYINKEKINLAYYLKGLKHIILPASTHAFKLYFSSLNYPKRNELIYKYRMLGLTNQWSDYSNSENSIDYNNLSSGTYQFQIKSSINNSDWSEVNKTDIIISTPHWRTWWAYFLYYILFAFLITLLLKNRLKLLRARFEEVRQGQISKKIFNSASNGICIVDKLMKIKTINKSYMRITGFKGYEVKGKDFIFSSNKKSSQRIKNTIIQLLHSNHRWNGEITIKTKQNKTISLELSINPMGDYKHNLNNEFFITFSNITERKSYEEKLKILSFYDGLTGLANRNLFIKKLISQKKYSLKVNRHFAIIYIDLNDFKKVNDHFGHSYGDKLLTILGSRFLRIFNNDITVARFGGDEFCLLISEKPNKDIYEEIKSLNLQLQKIFTSPFKIEGQDILISPAIGVSIFPTHSKNIEELLKFADIAMYSSKKYKNENYTIFNKISQKQLYPKVKLEIDLKKAIEKEQIQPFIQPQISVENNKIVGYEVLARWVNEENKIIGPDVFIPVAEESSIIDDLFLLLLRLTTNQFKLESNNITYNQLKLSFNISPNQLYNRSFMNKIYQTITQQNIPTKCIVLEITETALILKPKQAKQAMFDLKKLGFQIALDDFGTGHSSLTHLKEFPVDIIKIDKSFISCLLTNKNVYYIVESIILLALKLGITIIAEGVETLEEVKVLKKLKCQIIQGYFYGKPKAIKYYLSNPNLSLVKK